MPSGTIGKHTKGKIVKVVREVFDFVVTSVSIALVLLVAQFVARMGAM